MEDGAIVPEVVGRWGQISFGDIGYSPVDLCRCRGAQSLFVYVDGGLRDIEDGEIFVAAEEKVVDQGGFAAAYVNDGGGRWFGGALD